MTHPAFVASALVAALVALGVSVFAILGGANSPSSDGRRLAADGADIGDSDRRLVRLEAEVERLLRKIEDLEHRTVSGAPSREVLPAPTTSLTNEPSQAGSEERLLARFEALKNQLAPALEWAEAEQQRRQRDAVETQADLSELERIAIDTNLSGPERLQALRTLRGNQLPDGSDARTHNVIVSMLDLYRGSTSSDVRADIFRRLDGVTDPVLRSPLMDALARDTDARVREEAAETLAHYTDDPSVRLALEQALHNDQDSQVREQAEESLGRDQ